MVLYVNLGYFGLFQSKNSCIWCSFISVNTGQHVSTHFLFPGHYQVSPLFVFVCGKICLPSAMLHIAGTYFTYGLKYIYMAKILVIHSYMASYLFYLWLGSRYNTINTLW
jgi:hypothetical protein